MQLQIFQVEAFTDKVFGGNPAAVCPLQNWLLNDVMQRIAMENCVAETVFLFHQEMTLKFVGLHPKLRWIYVVIIGDYI